MREGPGSDQLRMARRRRIGLAVTSISAAIVAVGLVLNWPGSSVSTQPVVSAPTATLAPTTLAPSTLSPTILATSETSPVACGDSPPLLATIVPGNVGLDPEGTPGPGPDSLPSAENQLVAHWLTESVVIELRWPATAYMDEPGADASDLQGLPVTIGPWSVAADNNRILAQVQLSTEGNDPCSLLSVDGYGPHIDPVRDQVQGFVEGLVDEEGYDQFLAAIAEQVQQRSQELLCDQPQLEAGDGEMIVIVYEMCDDGMGTGTRPLSGLQPLERVLEASNTPLQAAFEALVRGPTPAETKAGFSSWFWPATADAVKSVTMDGGVAVIDLDSQLITSLDNVSTTNGGNYFRGQLYATAFAFQTITAVEFRLDGESAHFCGLMGLVSDCTPVKRHEWDDDGFDG